MTASGSTVSAARRRLARALAAAGIESPELDARVLVGHVLGLDHTGLAAQADRVLTATEQAAIAAVEARRLAREPVAHIIGRREFWGLELAVTPDVLVPRPDTETLVEAALAAIDAGPGRGARLRIADLCTGSGAILLALLSELPQAYGVGTDRSLPALAIARRNAADLRLSARAGFLACDCGTALTGGFDLVVANPPYIESAVIATLQPEVRDREPHLALDGGPDGLAAYRTIAADAGRLLRPAGRLLMEIGIGQEDAVTALCITQGLRAGPVIRDLAGIPRVVTATR